jgi:hypothetical protein
MKIDQLPDPFSNPEFFEPSKNALSSAAARYFSYVNEELTHFCEPESPRIPWLGQREEAWSPRHLFALAPARDRDGRCGEHRIHLSAR